MGKTDMMKIIGLMLNRMVAVRFFGILLGISFFVLSLDVLTNAKDLQEIPDNVIDFVNESDFHNSGFDQVMLIATVVQSFLFCLLVVSDFFSGHSWCIF